MSSDFSERESLSTYDVGVWGKATVLEIVTAVVKDKSTWVVRRTLSSDMGLA